MATTNREAQPLSRGVDELIERLRGEGVAAGREEADKLLADAKAEAHRTLDNARQEAKKLVENAKREADTYHAAGEAALKTAMRDAVLDMKTALMGRFSADVERLVSRQMAEPELLKQLILQVASRVRDNPELEGDAPLEVELPAEVMGLDELRRDPHELQQGPLTGIVLGLTGEILKEGVTLHPGAGLDAGIRLKAGEQGVEFDLSDQAVASLLLRHLQPRFRAVLEGIVK